MKDKNKSNLADVDFIIGGDPEFPCIDTATGRYISLVPYVEGTKYKPHPIPIPKCAQQIDNVAIEITTPPVPDYWIYKDIVDQCIEHTNNWLKDINPNYKLDIVSSARYEPEELESDIAMLFGCEPSYSVYRNDVSSRPRAEEVGDLRSFGYHIHYGFTKRINKQDMFDFIFLNDLFLGMPAVYKDTDWDRRRLYGNLSDYRIKSSSRVEYRTLGAGMHKYPEFIENGIRLIKENKHKIEQLKELFYDDLAAIDADNFSLALCDELKEKLIEHKIFNND